MGAFLTRPQHAMSYDFNAADQVANEYPNPFRIENRFLLLADTIYFAGGIYSLFIARGFMQSHQDGYAASAAFAALTMLGASVKLSIQAFSQLRFIFGRNFPIGLAEQLEHNEQGTSDSATHLERQMRERALHFVEPRGPLAGLLYALMKPLIGAPPTIQYAAQRHFESLIGMVSVLLSLAVSYVLFSGQPHEGIVSWAYLPLTGLTLIKPFMRADENEPPKDSRLIMMRMAALAVFAVMGPAMLPRFVPALAIPPMWIAPVCLLLGSIGASGLFFAAVLSRIDSAPQTAVSCEQTTISMHCQPAQLWAAIDRDFQTTWERGIPNRSYSKVLPDAAASKGSFNGSVLEETQPTPTHIIELGSVQEALRTKQSRYLALLGMWACAMAAGAAILAWYWTRNFAAMSRFEISRSLLTLIALQTSTLLAFRIGHVLWSRMYFKSRLIWVEVSGTYQSSEIDIGNQITGNARSRSTVVRIEDATLRVWGADIVSVAFGKDSERFVMAMAPVDGVVRAMAENLKGFAGSQSMVTAPTSSRDLDKVRALTGVSRSMGRYQAAEDMMRPLMHAAAVHADEDSFGVAAEDGMEVGWIKFYDEAKRFGFIRCADGIERYFRGSQIQGSAMRLNRDQQVKFKPVSGRNGPAAEDISVMT